MTTHDDPGMAIECQRLVEVLTDYLEGVLDADLVAEIEAHLALCDPCATYLEQMRTTIDLVGRVPVAGLSERATALLMDAFRGLRLGPRDG